MKTIIAGSRGITVLPEISPPWEITEVVSGTARGVDQLGEQWAAKRNIPVVRFPAMWNEYGKSAGRYRNEEMANYADALVAVWDGNSRGTAHMIDTAQKMLLPVHIIRV